MSIQIYNEGEATGYRLLEELQSGMEGRTWRAEQVGPDGQTLAVAVKILTPDSWLGGEVSPQEILRKWRGQMQVMRSFGHRGFAPVQVAFPISADPVSPAETPAWMVGIPAFVMTWINGSTLEQWSKDVTDPLRRVKVLEVCANGLDDFHHITGHVHRDLKPANIMVEDDVARVIDYGLIRSVDRVRSQSGLDGSMPYMDPVLFEGAEYSPAVDLFSFAGVIYHQLMRAHPIPGRLSPEIQGDLIRAGFDRVAVPVAYSLSPKPANRPEVAGAADLLDRVVSLMRPPPARRANPRPISYAEEPPASELVTLSTSSSPVSTQDLRRLVLARILAPTLAAGFITLLIVLALRLLTV